MARCGAVGDRTYYTGWRQPLQQTMPHSPDWAIGLMPETPVINYVSDPNNPHLYSRGEVRNYADLFVNRSANASGPGIILKVARNGGFAYAVEYAGQIWQVAGNTFVNTCGVVGSKIDTMIALQMTDFRSEQQVMYNQYRNHENRTIAEMEWALGLSYIEKRWLRR